MQCSRPVIATVNYLLCSLANELPSSLPSFFKALILCKCLGVLPAVLYIVLIEGSYIFFIAIF